MLYVVHVEEFDTYTGQTKKYLMAEADNPDQVATFSLAVGRFVIANMGNDWRYRRHAVLLDQKTGKPPVALPARVLEPVL